MASSYTVLGTEKMTTGENAGTWGTKTNTNLEIFEQAFGGYLAKSIAGGVQTTTLAITDGDSTASTSEARHHVIKLTGTITGNQTVTVPADIVKSYIVSNATSGAYTVLFKAASASGFTFAATNKGTQLLFADGTNIVDTGIGSVATYDLDGGELTLDADSDTSITASTDDQIDFEIAGADDFTMTANAFNVLTGSHATFADSANAKFGTGNDMLVYHDGTNSYITNSQGALKVATETSGIAVTIGHTTSEVTIADNLTVTGTLTLGSNAELTEAELEFLDGITAGTAAASKAMVADGNIDITGGRNITISGELDAATGDFSGDVDVDGTLEADAITIGSTAIGSIYGVVAGSSSIVTTGALDSGSITSGFGAIDNGTSNIRSATITAETAFVPDASGGADLGTTALEFNDLFLNDSGSIQFGDDQDTTLTHTDGTGLTLNSTNKLCFNDASQFVQGSSNAILSIGATDEIDLTATAVDLNGTLDVSGNAQFSGTVTVGVDDTGLDVKFFGASAGAYMEWDESADQLRIMGASADATTSTGKLLLATSLTDINANDVIGKIEFQAPHEAGGTDAITVAASIQALAQATFSSSVNATDLIFYTGHSETATEKFRFTSQGELGVGGANYGTDGQVLTSTGAGTAPAWEDSSGTITALNNATNNELVTIGSTTTELDAEANLTFTGSALTCIGTITTGVDNTGHDVKFFGATSGSFLLWDESDDALELTDSSPIKIGDGGDMTIYHDGTDSFVTNSQGGLKLATETSGIAVTIGHTTSETTVADNLTITGTTVGTSFDLNGTADGLILDANGNTTISSPTDDQIDFEIAGADDFTMTANTFTILSGSTIAIAAGGAITNAGSMAPDITSTGKALVMGF